MRFRWVPLAAALALGATATACGDDPKSTAGANASAVIVTPSLEPLTDAEVVARAGAAVWRVATDGCDWLGSGSAFAIDPHHLVTNRHVIANDTSPTLIAPDGEERRGRVIGTSDEHDVAVIQVEDTLPVTLQWAPTDALQPGEHVVVLGYPAPALTFTTTVGSIVNFQGRDGAREAMLTDAPISPGNSGGPGLRADATVAGVVTQMTLDDPNQRAAIVFSAASVEAAVNQFIADPDDEVLSDCGFGPDYVPPIPEHFDVPTPPPPPPTTATTAPLPLPTVPTPTVTTRPPATTRPAPPTTARPAPTTTTTTEPPVPANCPTTKPVVRITDVDHELEGSAENVWVVRADIEVTNDTGAPIDVEEVAAGLNVGPQVVEHPDDGTVAAGETRTFVLFDSYYSEYPGPSDPSASVAHILWNWLEPELQGCPHESADTLESQPPR